MSRKCDLLGTGVTTGNNVSHSNRKTKKIWRPNLQKKNIFIPELGKTVRVTISQKAMRTIDKKGGIMAVLRHMPDKQLSLTLRRVKKQLFAK
tara:strand:- start:928 stop:1203 length:276 start_codon:yes stop_codon:yes gene_type:complete